MIEGAREQQDRAVGGMRLCRLGVPGFGTPGSLCLALVALTGLFAYPHTQRFQGALRATGGFPNPWFSPAGAHAGIPDESWRSDPFRGALETPSVALLPCWLVVIVPQLRYGLNASYARTAFQPPSACRSTLPGWRRGIPSRQGSTGFCAFYDELVEECLAIGYAKKEFKLE